MSLEKVLLVAPRGFCAGVVRAVDIVEEALQVTRPIYVRKEIVHNKFVVENLRDKGAIFVNELEEVPDGTAKTRLFAFFRRMAFPGGARSRQRKASFRH